MNVMRLALLVVLLLPVIYLSIQHTQLFLISLLIFSFGIRNMKFINLFRRS